MNLEWPNQVAVRETQGMTSGQASCTVYVDKLCSNHSLFSSLGKSLEKYATTSSGGSESLLVTNTIAAAS